MVNCKFKIKCDFKLKKRKAFGTGLKYERSLASSLCKVEVKNLIIDLLEVAWCS